MKPFCYLMLACLAISCQISTNPEVRIDGELMQWHKLTLNLNGPAASESGEVNPFLDYRLEATFTHGGTSYTVPGYFAADGNAGESSAREGNIWRIHFRPDVPGTWTYKISFLRGKNLAVLDTIEAGEAVGPDGWEGSLEIEASDKSAPDLRYGGRIVNGGKGYFRVQGTQGIWIKNGADSPENFLAYRDFDQTLRFSMKTDFREGEANPENQIHAYEPHVADWKEGDPTWQGGKGKGIIGALNYLQSAGVNSVYMLTLNIMGDGNDVWPYTDYNERYRFDCSKLDQWEVVFDHMEGLGIMMHFVLQETENECLLDIGQTGVQRRLYLRELVARFGHHLGVTWNMGEENGPAPWTPVGQTDQMKKDMATYLKQINPWPSNVVLHTHADDAHQEEYLNPMLGFESLDGPSLQIGDPLRVHERVKYWVDASEQAGKRWIVNLDEIGPAWKGVLPDEVDPGHDTVRRHCLWGTLLAGGTGVEWYFGYRYAHNDLMLEDFRSRDLWWRQSALATRFLSALPLEDMQCRDDLVNVDGAYCLAKEGEVYVIYLPAGTAGSSGAAGKAGSAGPTLRAALDVPLKLRWFNPRSGGELLEGSVESVSGSGPLTLGLPPSDTGLDWVLVLMK